MIAVKNRRQATGCCSSGHSARRAACPLRAKSRRYWRQKNKSDAYFSVVRPRVVTASTSRPSMSRCHRPARASDRRLGGKSIEPVETLQSKPPDHHRRQHKCFDTRQPTLALGDSCSWGIYLRLHSNLRGNQCENQWINDSIHGRCVASSLFSGNHLDNAENDNYRNERRKKSLDPGSLNPLLPTLLQFH